jgi:hypothetical protein
MEYTVNFLLANLHEGQWFGFRKTDDEGNKISDDQRMKLSNVILTDFGKQKNYKIPTQDELDAKKKEFLDLENLLKTKKASGKQKLKNLGLDDEEINALLGA